MDILISGASTGIGKACAIHLARKGAVVWAGVRSRKSYDEILKLNVQGLKPVFLDVTDSQSIAAAVSEVKKKSGTLFGLINNAGIAIGGPVEGVRMENWRKQFDINFFGQIELTQACLPLIRESKGRILNMSSIAGRIASPYMGPYSASKFALEAFSDSLRREVRRYGVRVSIIEPGAIKTPIWEKSVAVGHEHKAELSEEVQSLYGGSLDKFLKELVKYTESGAPVAVVVKAVEHALSSAVPKIRYPVGRGISLAAQLVNVVPDAWIDQIIRAKT
jgi:NAD(P)-dependent dehydrogenase (short-subunit alcohol dehydrogenase family)